jgi:hypothetical protein
MEISISNLTVDFIRGISTVSQLGTVRIFKGGWI